MNLRGTNRPFHEISTAPDRLDRSSLGSYRRADPLANPGVERFDGGKGNHRIDLREQNHDQGIEAVRLKFAEGRTGISCHED